VNGHHDHEIRVDGVTLREKHQETLEIGAWDETGLTLKAALGDLVFQPTDGPSRVVATVHEIRTGDARLVYANGVLSTQSTSGEPSALGDATVYVRGELPALVASTGMGDLDVRGLRVAGDVRLETGLGDVDLVDAGAGGRIALSSGMGDVSVRTVEAAEVRAASGMGDVELKAVRGKLAHLGSGMGDVTLHGCAFEEIDAETGMGDVACRETTYGKAELDSGFGRVVR
jgi:DUF4097 and DUF4098 domain-containing protein YvlB